MLFYIEKAFQVHHKPFYIECFYYERGVVLFFQDSGTKMTTEFLIGLSWSKQFFLHKIAFFIVFVILKWKLFLIFFEKRVIFKLWAVKFMKLVIFRIL